MELESDSTARLGKVGSPPGNTVCRRVGTCRAMHEDGKTRRYSTPIAHKPGLLPPATYPDPFARVGI